jgi:hypothetical protein
MRADVVSGAGFPDYELPDYATKRRKRRRRLPGP